MTKGVVRCSRPGREGRKMTDRQVSTSRHDERRKARSGEVQGRFRRERGLREATGKGGRG